MSRRTATLFALIALLAASALPAGSAAAASPKVLLTRFAEEGPRPPATPGEAARIGIDVENASPQWFCAATDGAATLGANPAGTVKVSGSDQPLETFCGGEGEPQASFTVKALTISKAGLVKLTGSISIGSEGCLYHASKLTGTQAFGADVAGMLTATGKLERKHSAKSCAATMPIEDFVYAGDRETNVYQAELTS